MGRLVGVRRVGEHPDHVGPVGGGPRLVGVAPVHHDVRMLPDQPHEPGRSRPAERREADRVPAAVFRRGERGPRCPDGRERVDGPVVEDHADEQLARAREAEHPDRRPESAARPHRRFVPIRDVLAPHHEGRLPDHPAPVNEVHGDGRHVHPESPAGARERGAPPAVPFGRPIDRPAEQRRVASPQILDPIDRHGRLRRPAAVERRMGGGCRAHRTFSLPLPARSAEPFRSYVTQTAGSSTTTRYRRSRWSRKSS